METLRALAELAGQKIIYQEQRPNLGRCSLHFSCPPAEQEEKSDTNPDQDNAGKQQEEVQLHGSTKNIIEQTGTV